MFESNEQAPLDEAIFEEWLEKGRASKLNYQYLLVVWSSWDQAYQPVYVSERSDLLDHTKHLELQETAVAAYDLYSESRISLEGLG